MRERLVRVGYAPSPDDLVAKPDDVSRGIAIGRRDRRLRRVNRRAGMGNAADGTAAIMRSGLAGLIKVALAIRNAQIPPSLNYESPNPKIAFGQNPFFVNTQLSEWQGIGGIRRGAINALGPRMLPQSHFEPSLTKISSSATSRLRSRKSS